MKFQTIFGQKIYYYPSQDPVIQHLEAGSLYGNSNYNTLSRFIVNEGDIVDCGAHIGTFALFPSIFNKKHNLILIEAANKNFECLQKTFENNKNVTLHHAIVMSNKSQCDFEEESGPFGMADYNPNGNRISSTLDELLEGRKIAAIKLDIEGNEIEALKGATKVLQQKPPLLVEVNGHCLRLLSKTPQDFFSLVEEFGYSSYLISGRTLIKVDKNEKFPFCVMDVVCLHDDTKLDYSFQFDFSDPLPKAQIKTIMQNNIANSNGDCKEYFSSIGE